MDSLLLLLSDSGSAAVESLFSGLGALGLGFRGVGFGGLGV